MLHEFWYSLLAPLFQWLMTGPLAVIVYAIIAVLIVMSLGAARTAIKTAGPRFFRDHKPWKYLGLAFVLIFFTDIAGAALGALDHTIHNMWAMITVLLR